MDSCVTKTAHIQISKISPNPKLSDLSAFRFSEFDELLDKYCKRKVCKEKIFNANLCPLL